jgi:UDP-glucose 4-epimerase
MRVLITGGGGFIGSHLAEHLLETTDARLHLVDNFSTGVPDNVVSLQDERRVEVEEFDVRDKSRTAAAVSDADRVYHLAAAVGVERVVDRPLESIRTNVVGTENVLDPAAEDGTPVFVASSSEVYGKSTELPFSEDDDRLVGPTSSPRWGYANAKAMDEFYALAHHHENELPIVVGRFFNVVGPRQVGDYGMVVPTFVEQALRGDPITVYGDGTQTRCFTHVQDAVEIAHDLLETPAANGHVVNVGSKERVSIRELAERVKTAVDSDSEIEHVPLSEAFDDDFEEPDHRYPDTDRLESLLGYTPETPLEEIIADTVAEREKKVEV